MEEGEAGAVVTGVVDIAGGAVFDPSEPTMGNTLGVGIAADELTPRFAISQESSGIPTLGKPPGTVGIVEIGVDDDAAMLLEPKPHIPDTDTGPVAVVVDIPDIGSDPGFAADAAIPGDMLVLAVPGAAEVFIAVAPTVAAVATEADPIASPPPS